MRGGLRVASRRFCGGITARASAESAHPPCRAKRDSCLNSSHDERLTAQVILSKLRYGDKDLSRPGRFSGKSQCRGAKASIVKVRSEAGGSRVWGTHRR